MKKTLLFIFLLLTSFCSIASDGVLQERRYEQVLISQAGHNGDFSWKMKKAGDILEKPEDISTTKINDSDWMPAIVPGTVLNSLVYNKVYPEPYYGLNNKLESNLIPDLYHAGRDFYTYWFRTEFVLDKSVHSEKKTWLQVDGINYRAEIW
ncbi:hypothetical protein EZS27_030483, partial [termite gut metagenome]